MSSFYAVRVGRTPGVYLSWLGIENKATRKSITLTNRLILKFMQFIFPSFNRSECEVQVKGFPGCKYKKFKTKQEALEFIDPNVQPTVKEFPIFQIIKNEVTTNKVVDDETSKKIKRKSQTNLSKGILPLMLVDWSGKLIISFIKRWIC